MNEVIPQHTAIADRAARPGMVITICTGTGEGPTALAAFDAALGDAGIADHNLLSLSSVIPPDAILLHGKYRMPPADYGRRLYVVLSEMRQCEAGREAHAGIGWIQDEDSGRGLFVELHDSDRTRLETALHETLGSMRGRRTARYGRVNTLIESRRCTDAPVCALVAAVYACEPW